MKSRAVSLPRRYTAAFLSLAVFSLLAAACQPVVTPALPQATPTATAAPARPTPTVRAATAAPTAPTHFQIDPDALRGLEVRLWHSWGGETARVAARLATEFNRENVWGVRVKVSARGSAGLLVDEVAQAGDGATLVAVSLDRLAQLNQRDGLADLKPYVSHPEWGLSADEIDDYLPALWQVGEATGERLGIPAEQTAQVMIYNRTWAKELGFSGPPLTLDEFEAQTCAAAKANATDQVGANDGTGGWIINRQAMTVLSWWGSFGADVTGPGSDARFGSPEAEQAFAYVRGLFDQGCAWNSRLPDAQAYFTSRHALIYTGTLKEVEIQARYLAQAASQDEWLVLPFPAEEGQPALYLEGTHYGILPSSDEEQLAAWLFLRWLIVPRNQARLAEANGGLPLTGSARQEMAAYAEDNPQWAGVLEWLPQARLTPADADWWLASRLLEDAAWQLIQPTPQPVETILELADQTLSEILATVTP